MTEEAQLLADLLSISTDSKTGLPLHRQLCEKIRRAILQGAMAPQSRLPSSRALAKSLMLSRNTVSTAYDQLIAEGFLTTRRGAGTYVADLNTSTLTAANHQHHADDEPKATPPLSSRLKAIPDTGNIATLGGKRLIPGFVDPELFPYSRWNSLYKQCSRNIAKLIPQVDLSNGYLPLCKALSQHLAVTRGVNARPEQIFITMGAAQSVTLITKVLTDPGDSAWVEEPGYPIVARSLALADLKLEPTAVDRNGLNPNAGQIKNSCPRLISASTSYQFPLGFTMPVNRRLKLLEIAREKQCWIIEDDYDGEFRYRGAPIPSLFGLENNQRTIYMGTFSKTLSLTLRTGFIVVPNALMPAFQKIYPMLGNFSSMVTQAVLAEFIVRGYFARHIAHMRKVYGARRHSLERALINSGWAAATHEDSPPGGLHLTVQLNGSVSDTQVLQDIADEQLGCIPLSRLYNTATQQFFLDKRQGFLLGFTSCNAQVIEEAVAVLHQAVSQRGGSFGAIKFD